MNALKGALGWVFNLALIALMFLFVEGCDPGQGEQGPQYGKAPLLRAGSRYFIAVHPLHNPSKLIQAYQPLVEYLNNRMNGSTFELVASRDYGNFESKFRARQPDFLLPNPWQTLEAIKVGYKVIAMAGDPADFKGIFLVRRDSNIRAPGDLKGKSVSYPSPTALAACIMPQFFLHDHGVNVNTEIKNLYVGSQESSIMNVFLKHTAAAATWPTPWRLFQKEHPVEASALTLIWETPPLINNSFMARNDVPATVSEQIRDTLANLHLASEGISILEGMEITRFRVASDPDYEMVRAYVALFEKEIRPVEKK